MGKVCLRCKEKSWSWSDGSLYKISNKVLVSKIYKQCPQINKKASNTKLTQKNEQAFCQRWAISKCAKKKRKPILK